MECCLGWPYVATAGKTLPMGSLPFILFVWEEQWLQLNIHVNSWAILSDLPGWLKSWEQKDGKTTMDNGICTRGKKIDLCTWEQRAKPFYCFLKIRESYVSQTLTGIVLAHRTQLWRKRKC